MKLWGEVKEIYRYPVKSFQGERILETKVGKLISKRLVLGEVELELIDKCERCSMVTVNPDELKSDPALLKCIVDQLEGCFGVYAKVMRTGIVRAEDKVYLMLKSTFSADVLFFDVVY